MPNYSFTLNGETVTVDAPADLSVLWALRDKLGVTGPKYGCGINVCKACTSHLDDAVPFNPCVTDIAAIEGRDVTTIEGLADGDVLHPVQEAWLEQDVAQCGFCQPGQIMQAVALLKRTSNPTDADIDALENTCRCGTYFRIRQAIKSAAAKMAAAPPPAQPTAQPTAEPTGRATVEPAAALPTSAIPRGDALAATGGGTAAAAVGAGLLGAAAVAHKVLGADATDDEGTAPA